MPEQDQHEIQQAIRRLAGLSASNLEDADIDTGILLDVVRRGSSDLRSRLFACEILLRRDAQTFLPEIGARTAAAIYAAALRESPGVDLNVWGFLGMGDLGPFGKHLVACGEAGTAALAPLLDDARPAGLYGGSKEAKIGNSDNPRVCDFAAFLIAAIRRLPYTFHRNDFTARNAEITRLRMGL